MNFYRFIFRHLRKLPRWAFNGFRLIIIFINIFLAAGVVASPFIAMSYGHYWLAGILGFTIIFMFGALFSNE